jgi:hypothetical protein
MRNLLAFLAAATLTLVAVGWYLDWYRISSVSTGTDHHSIQIDINSKKIREDVQRGVHRGEEKLHQVLDKERPDAAAESTKPESLRAVPLVIQPQEGKSPPPHDPQ